MFVNLKNVLYQKHITMKQYAELLGVSEKSVQNKIYGVTDFTYPEFKRTCSFLLEYNADYLFCEEERPKQTA